ncbi:hypothetical protein ES703_43535 [subsurface metagenome]
MFEMCAGKKKLMYCHAGRLGMTIMGRPVDRTESGIMSLAAPEEVNVESNL